MFDTLIVQPIFNLLVLIYALIPGHNFGLAIILFTIVVRLLLWPLVKKQLHQTKLMRRIQPELQRIAKETKGDRQRQALLQMELYKEKGISPFRSIGIVLLQFPILIGLYIGLQKVIEDRHEIVDFAYGPLQNLPWMKQLADNIDLFDMSLFGIINLQQPAIGKEGLYIPALLLVAGSALIQYIQAKQLMPSNRDSRGLRAIFKDASEGKQADSQEVNNAVMGVTVFFLPLMIFFFTIGLASALSLYWIVGGLVAYAQQSYVLREDEDEMEKLADEKPVISNKTATTTKTVKSTKSKITISNIPEAELVEATPSSDIKAIKKKASKAKAKKRKRR